MCERDAIREWLEPAVEYAHKAQQLVSQYTARPVGIPDEEALKRLQEAAYLLDDSAGEAVWAAEAHRQRLENYQEITRSTQAETSTA